MERIKLNILKNSTILLMTLAWVLGGCTQGQQGQTPEPKVTTAGTEAQGEDVCEKDENLDNILCQWVTSALEFMDGTYKFQYDSEGRIILANIYDKDGVQQGVMTVVYNDDGVWKLRSFTNPNPPGTGNYQNETRLDYDYYSPGQPKSKTMENYSNGMKASSIQWAFNPMQGDYIDSVIVYRDGANNINQIQYQRATYYLDSGKLASVVRKEYLGNTLQNPGAWVQDSYDYNTDTGRLDVYLSKTQDCSVNPCNNFSNPFTPTTISEIRYHYDDKDRETGYTQSYVHGGGAGMESEMTYEIDTRAKIAGIHPLEFMINTFSPIPLNLGINDRDIFSHWTDNQGGQLIYDVTFKWARLWELLPEGQPPGGPNP